jgi:hypothetical protein
MQKPLLAKEGRERAKERRERGMHTLLSGVLLGVLLAFFLSYIEHDLRKNKIVVLFFCQQINFYELIVRF